MTIMLLGADGQLGLAIQAQPQWQGVNSIKFNRQQLDITNFGAVAAQFQQHKPSIVINCAAYTAVEQAEQQPELCYKVNAEAVSHLAQLCQLHDCLLIQFSTDYVFSGDSQKPYSEGDIPAPLNVYGKSKKQAELAIQRSNCKHFIIRTSWLFSEFGNNFYSNIVAKLKTRQALTIVADQYGCPTYAGDLAQRVMQLVQDHDAMHVSAYGVYHICGQPAVSWYQFACVIGASHNIQANITPVSTTEWPSKVNRPAYSVLDCNRMVSQFRFTIPCWQTAVTQLAKG